MAVMRVRQVVRVDLADGTLEASAEVLPGDVSVSQRFAELRASLPVGIDGARVATVACDDCPARAEVDYEDPQLPDGWVTTHAGEFCPACVTSDRVPGA